MFDTRSLSVLSLFMGWWAHDGHTIIRCPLRQRPRRPGTRDDSGYSFSGRTVDFRDDTRINVAGEARLGVAESRSDDFHLDASGERQRGRTVPQVMRRPGARERATTRRRQERPPGGARVLLGARLSRSRTQPQERLRRRYAIGSAAS